MSFNTAIISKLVWMSRKLRHIDDLKVLISWVDTKYLIKLLLFLQPSCTDTKTDGLESSSRYTSCSQWNTSIKNNSDNVPGSSDTDETRYKKICEPSKSTILKSRSKKSKSNNSGKLPSFLKQPQLRNLQLTRRLPMGICSPVLHQDSATNNFILTKQ